MSEPGFSVSSLMQGSEDRAMIRSRLLGGINFMLPSIWELSRTEWSVEFEQKRRNRMITQQPVTISALDEDKPQYEAFGCDYY